MKIGESPVFVELSKALLDYYEWWNQNADTPGTKRSIVGVSNGTSCHFVFRGNQEDYVAIKKFLEKRDNKK